MRLERSEIARDSFHILFPLQAWALQECTSSYMQGRLRWAAIEPAISNSTYEARKA